MNSTLTASVIGSFAKRNMPVTLRVNLLKVAFVCRAIALPPSPSEEFLNTPEINELVAPPWKRHVSPAYRTVSFRKQCVRRGIPPFFRKKCVASVYAVMTTHQTHIPPSHDHIPDHPMRSSDTYYPGHVHGGSHGILCLQKRSTIILQPLLGVLQETIPNYIQRHRLSLPLAIPTAHNFRGLRPQILRVLRGVVYFGVAGE